jgi:hypothetical protein
MIEVFGFGLSVLFCPLMEWVVPPLVAIKEGLRARVSIPRALIGIPLVFLFAVVTPTLKGKNTVIPAEVPWLAHHSMADPMVSILLTRLLLWGAIFCVFMAVGIVLRRLKPLSRTE